MLVKWTSNAPPLDRLWSLDRRMRLDMLPIGASCTRVELWEQLTAVGFMARLAVRAERGQTSKVATVAARHVSSRCAVP